MVQIDKVKLIAYIHEGMCGGYQNFVITDDKKVYRAHNFDSTNIKDEIEATYVGEVTTLEIEKTPAQKLIVMDAMEIQIFGLHNKKMRLKFQGCVEFRELPCIAKEILEINKNKEV